MSNAVLSQSDGPPAAVKTGFIVALVLAAWLAAVSFMGATGALVTAPGEQSPALLITVLGPLVVFFAAFRLSRSFHDFVATVDLRLITSIQAWRAGGLVFIALSAYGILPGFFAWPAGWGDIAIGVTAPWLLLSLIRKPGFSNSTTFRIWNWLGLLDLVVASRPDSAVDPPFPGDRLEQVLLRADALGASQEQMAACDQGEVQQPDDLLL